MNTQYKRTIFLALTALLWFSCSKKLDQTPQTDLSDVNFWNNTNDMKLACNYLYSFLPPIETHTDDDMSADAFGLSAAFVVPLAAYAFIALFALIARERMTGTTSELRTDWSD